MNPEEKNTRRDFIQKSSAITAGSLVFPALIPTSVLGENAPGKHVCMEKAFTVAPMHGKAVVEAVKKTGVTGRLDSEFRSIREFNRAIELVHNRLIEELVEVEVGVPGELSGSAPGPQEIKLT